ncbi:MAG TPA: peroxiredoxin [Sphingomicrobium sp.]|jgi:peroxiredoxin|nr:peroxiredoxin [Sphingomicrobium sp.]
MRALLPIIFGTIALSSQPLAAALPVGAQAPDFTTLGAVGGKPFKLHLKDQLKHGPLVLYFFPKAFTQGCTLEAKAFADAMPEFRKAGARVVGLSADNLDTLKKFSTEACRSKFPVATASPETIKAYDVVLKQKPELTDRTSYVIDRKGRIVMVHSELDWKDHVARTLAAVQALKG